MNLPWADAANLDRRDASMAEPVVTFQQHLGKANASADPDGKESDAKPVSWQYLILLIIGNNPYRLLLFVVAKNARCIRICLRIIILSTPVIVIEIFILSIPEMACKFEKKTFTLFLIATVTKRIYIAKKPLILVANKRFYIRAEAIQNDTQDNGSC